MARIKRGVVSRRKHNKLRESVKGYRMTRSRLVRVAAQAELHAGQYAFIGRKLRKRDMRSLWITRISGALKDMNLSYSKFMNELKTKGITLNRKVLSEMIATQPDSFKKLVEQVKV